ncbi:MAG: penicillin-binding protein [Rhodospirillaceae bacterium]|nr:penicillin-binding protein [Rhodospirillaceae bacterium]
MGIWKHTSGNNGFVYPGTDIISAISHKIEISDQNEAALEVSRNRLTLSALLCCLSFIIVASRLLNLTLADANSNLGPIQHSTNTAEIKVRADIVDRKNRIIATTLPLANLWANPKKIINIKQTVDLLISALPELNHERLTQRLQSQNSFIYIKRNLGPLEHQKINDLGLPGVYFEESRKRVHPYDNLFSHTVGITDTDNIGMSGLESYFNKRLFKVEKPLTLSLDIGVQSTIHNILSKSVKRFKATGGSTVVMAANTGQILGLVSLPDFNIYNNKENSSNFFNTAIQGTFEMGSTFKLFTAAMAIDEGLVNLNTIFDASKPLKIANHVIHDFHPKNRPLTVREILIYSSNIGAAQMASEVGPENQKKFLDRLNLLSALDLETHSLGRPQYPKVWRPIDTAVVSYGHGISVTPVHVALAVSALVNGGTLPKPTLLKNCCILGENNTRVISAKTSKIMRSLMRQVVTEGSGKNADVPGYNVGGKTGSAEIAELGQYSNNRLNTSFVAAFPMDNPKYVVFVMLEDPKGLKEHNNQALAGWNAAPTAANIIKEISPILGVYPNSQKIDKPRPSSLVQARLSSGKNIARAQHDRSRGPNAIR